MIRLLSNNLTAQDPAIETGSCCVTNPTGIVGFGGTLWHVVLAGLCETVWIDVSNTISR